MPRPDVVGCYDTKWWYELNEFKHVKIKPGGATMLADNARHIEELDSAEEITTTFEVPDYITMAQQHDFVFLEAEVGFRSRMRIVFSLSHAGRVLDEMIAWRDRLN